VPLAFTHTFVVTLLENVLKLGKNLAQFVLLLVLQIWITQLMYSKLVLWHSLMLLVNPA